MRGKRIITALVAVIGLFMIWLTVKSFQQEVINPLHPLAILSLGGIVCCGIIAVYQAYKSEYPILCFAFMFMWVALIMLVFGVWYAILATSKVGLIVALSVTLIFCILGYIYIRMWKKHRGDF